MPELIFLVRFREEVTVEPIKVAELLHNLQRVAIEQDRLCWVVVVLGKDHSHLHTDAESEVFASLVRSCLAV
jgi:hypothetical protein